MSNKYFDSANNPNRALPYEVARAEQINNTDDLIEAGLNLVEADVNRAIKLPADVTTDQVLTSTAAQRQNSLLAFDASGNATLTGTDVAARTGKVMGWDSSGNINLYSYANDITAPVNAAAASASAAATSATNSASSATNSANSATASATSATNSASSANLASDWAQKTTGEVVTGQGYSAKYWAEQAAVSVADGVIDDAATSTLTTWSSSKIGTDKQNTLVSGTNIKTINSTSILGSGDIATITPTGTETLTNKTIVDPILGLSGTNGLAGQVPVSQGDGLPPVWGSKQDTLVSGTNIKTINGGSVLGSGDLVISTSPQVMIVEQQATSGSNGGTANPGVWQKRLLNTVVQNSISGASLSSNNITLPAGTYVVQAVAQAGVVSFNKTKIYNETDSSDLVIGSSANAGSSEFKAIPTPLMGVFTLTGTKQISLLHRTTNTYNTTDFGYGVGYGVVEVFASVYIERI